MKPKSYLYEGDNLAVLTSLLPHYKEKIDVIYIDPPYNVKAEIIKYNDQYKDWNAMMAPLLSLSHQLLSDTGVIFISISFKQLSPLKLLMDKIFKEKNLLQNCVVITRLTGTPRRNFQNNHEYLLVYAKRNQSNLIKQIPYNEKQLKSFNLQDNQGKYKLITLQKMGGSNEAKYAAPQLRFPIYFNPKNKKITIKKKKGYLELLPQNTNGTDGIWTWGQRKLLENLDLIVVKLNKTNEYKIYRKSYLTKERGITVKSIWDKPEYTTANGTSEIKAIFGSKMVFSWAKSLVFIKDIIQIASKKNSIILDFFAGSGTTAQATIELNKEDGGKRSFILIQNDENNICQEITYQRILRTIIDDCNLVVNFSKENL